jgi:hypothetical protein
MKTKLVIILIFFSLFVLAQNGSKTIKSTFSTISKYEHVSYFEVTSEMFKMLSESKNASPEFKAYVSKLHQLKLVKAGGGKPITVGNNLYEAFMAQTDLRTYDRLMTKKEGKNQLSFYKREINTKNEFLLISTEMIIYITGTIELKSIGEFEQVMEIAGSAFEM